MPAVPGPYASIGSLRNPRVLAARKLLKRSEREKTRHLLVEGPLAIAAALGAGAVVELFVDRDAVSAGELQHQAERAGVAVHVVTPAVITALSDTIAPQGVVAVARAPTADPGVLERVDLVVVLAQVRDPGNAGTLIRSSVAAGAGAVVFTKGSVDPFNSKTVRASAGTVFNVPVVIDVTMDEAARRLRAAGTRIVGAHARAERPLDEVDMTAPVALVVGNEAWGLPEGSGELLDDVVGIPMPGPAESLNAGIAGSILLFEAVRQRRPRA